MSFQSHNISHRTFDPPLPPSASESRQGPGTKFDEVLCGQVRHCIFHLGGNAIRLDDKSTVLNKTIHKSRTQKKGLEKGRGGKGGGETAAVDTHQGTPGSGGGERSSNRKRGERGEGITRKREEEVERDWGL